jgi:anti-sigma regulatory factor (Ser/Thr protein kinase)
VGDNISSIVVQAELNEFSRLSAWAEDVVGRMGVSPSTSFAIRLCLEEAFSNIVRHGFFDGMDGSEVGKDIHLTLERIDGAVMMTIEDGGIAFDPRSVPAPAVSQSIEDAIVGGQGINLMRQFAQQLDYERLDRRNRLRLRFEVA